MPRRSAWARPWREGAGRARRCSTGRRGARLRPGQALLRRAAAELDSTVFSQPALFVTSLAALEPLKQDSPELVDRLRRDGRLEPGRVHGPGLRRRDGLRSRPAAGARARPGHAGRRRRHAQRHGQHPGPGARAGRSTLRPSPRRRDAANRQPALPRQHRRLRRQRGLRTASPSWPRRPAR